MIKRKTGMREIISAYRKLDHKKREMFIRHLEALQEPARQVSSSQQKGRYTVQ
jgi:hypothetical protein